MEGTGHYQHKVVVQILKDSNVTHMNSETLIQMDLFMKQDQTHSLNLW